MACAEAYCVHRSWGENGVNRKEAFNRFKELAEGRVEHQAFAIYMVGVCYNNGHTSRVNRVEIRLKCRGMHVVGKGGGEGGCPCDVRSWIMLPVWPRCGQGDREGREGQEVVSKAMALRTPLQ